MPRRSGAPPADASGGALKFILVAVGQRVPGWVGEGYAEYARRMPPESRLELVEIKAEARSGGRTAVQMMEAEGERILAAVPPGACLVVLDERGRDTDTRSLAALYERWRQEGRDVAFAVGGPDGLSPAVKARADVALRLSSLTLPHAMVRVILAEALYRAVSLARGHPYHRE